jgi:hypothetical protein
MKQTLQQRSSLRFCTQNVTDSNVGPNNIRADKSFSRFSFCSYSRTLCQDLNLPTSVLGSCRHSCRHFWGQHEAE